MVCLSVCPLPALPTGVSRQLLHLPFQHTKFRLGSLCGISPFRADTYPLLAEFRLLLQVCLEWGRRGGLDFWSEAASP